MATYRQVYGDFWNDSKVVNKFTPEDRYFFLYLLTNSHTNICGCYEISYRQMAWETGYNEETIKKLMKRMEFELDVIRYSDKTNEVLILKWHKYNWNSSPKVVKSLQTVSEYIKDEEFKKYIISLLDGDTIPYPYHIQSDGYGMDTSVSVSVSVSDSVSASDIKKIPPKKEDVEAYCKEKGYTFDVNRFYDYYESNGWKVGKNKMKDWRAAVRSWAARQREDPKKQSAIDMFSEYIN